MTTVLEQFERAYSPSIPAIVREIVLPIANIVQKPGWR